MDYVDRLEGWLHLSTPLIFECHERLDECTIRLGYMSFLTIIAFRRKVIKTLIN